MATPPSLSIDSLLAELAGAEIAQHPVEVHGSLVGLICGGVGRDKSQWFKALLDLINDGQLPPPSLTQLLEELYQDTLARITDADFGFTPMAPEEEEPLSSRVEALSLWVQSFLTGIAMVQPKLNRASKDIKEVINDLAEITQVEFDVVDDPESEAAYIELLEFTRMSALLCYAEFVREPGIKDQDSTLH
ncbi:UPF0149 family protein [Shewanella sp. AS1]|uniref:UPF0149 family protein n=1 Tax=Shewanella sp. AS1 TaxID=2907626 RepID=UPI001F20E239|nr:UPF0149 family protein [Shewanella sp. AS1]MCE9679375.1 UPF0149 family protein [Shewanella sp. AS1]